VVKAVRVDIDWLRTYAEQLDRRGDEAQAAHRSLTGHQLEPEAFGELGRALGTPAAYQRAADRLHEQLEQAGRVLTAAAGALREAAEHYAGGDSDAARTLDRKAQD
jgi:hypothetical protein